MAKSIEKYDRIINRWTEADETRPNIDGAIWDEDIEGIAAAMRESGISEFTISINSLSFLQTLDAFKGYGVVVQDVVKVNSLSTDFRTGEPQKIPAILMKVM